MSDAKTMVTVVSNAEEKFEVPLKAISKSEVVKRLFEDLGDTAKDQPIPIDATSEVLKLVIEWLNKHVDDSAGAAVEMTEWDKAFVNKDVETLFGIIVAASYLQIQDLLDMCCKSVAEMIKGKSVEEIRKAFGIQNDFTPEEEEQLRQEHAWCEE